MLGVRPGDTIAAEVLEGVRPTRSIPVVGLVDELIGVSAYMDIHALNELMREGERYRGAYLTVVLSTSISSIPYLNAPLPSPE